MTSHDQRYAQLLRRDADADGRFFVAVSTTRIYCRPVCPARTPLSRNITFYDSATAAREAGYRPCLRCRPESAPDSPAWLGTLASVQRALRRIEEGALVDMSVDTLADGLGMTGRHLRRLFLQHLGVSPIALEQTRRIHLAKTLIHDTSLPMTEIAFAAGFGSLRRFNEVFQTLFARPPSALRREAGAAIGPGTSVRLKLAYREPCVWTQAAATDQSHTLAAEDGGGRITLTQGVGRTIAVELEGVPLHRLAKVIAQVRRHWTAPVDRPLAAAA